MQDTKNEIITINKAEITSFVEEAGKLVFKKQAEGSLLKLLDTIDFLNEQLVIVKEKILNAGLLISPDFKGVIGERVRASVRSYGDRYDYTEEAESDFIKTITFQKVDSKAVDEYLKTHKSLPKGIALKDRTPAINISRINNEQIEA